MTDRLTKALKAFLISAVLSVLSGTAHAQLSLAVNGTTFRSGDTIRVDLSATNPAEAFTGDFYFGVVHPDAVTATLITNLSPLAAVTVRFDGDPQAFVPLARSVAVPQGFSVTLDDFFVYTLAGEPQGPYLFFAFLTTARELVNDDVGATELLAFDFKGISIAPHVDSRAPRR